MAQAKKMLKRLKRFEEGGEVELTEDQVPSRTEAAKQMLRYKKTAATPELPSGVVPDTGQADGIYQQPTVTSETARVFGMQPREDRLSILPRYSRETGLVAPEMLYEAARAFVSPSVAARGYEVAPEDAINTALNFTGAGIGTSKAMRNPTGEGGFDIAMNAYHGSPYDIQGRFDINKVGTGANAQQYGHGMYFSDAKDVAKNFTGDSTNQSGAKGNLYAVDIPDDQVAKMLDWNKPLSQQSPEVLKILKNNPAIKADLASGKTLDKLTGENAYQAIASGFDVGQKEAYKLASEFLNKQGIPGIRYLDKSATGKEIKASNFVVFDPDMVKMLTRNDEPVSTLPSSTTAKEDLANVPGVLPKAERDADLNKIYDTTTPDITKAKGGEVRKPK